MILQLTVSNIAQYYMYTGNAITVWKQAPRSTMLAPNYNSIVSPTAIICVLGKLMPLRMSSWNAAKSQGLTLSSYSPKLLAKPP
jgi:hypothetical protein